MEVITNPPRSVLAVTPHPDDCEGGCGGTLAKWIKEAGTEVVIVLCTNGDKGTSDREMSSEALATIREQEQQEAADVLGVKEVVFLSHPDGGLEDNREFRSEIVREIRRNKPEVVMCIDPYRSFSHTHRDHRMSGQVTVDAAVSYAWSSLHFPEQIAQEGLEPHRVSAAYLWGGESPDICVDISEHMDAKMDSLSMHASQMSGRQVDRAEWIRRWASRSAESTGFPYAESYRRVNFDFGTLSWQLMTI
jgi:LmbE family N-acetylglucosaminyl deacetylase